MRVLLIEDDSATAQSIELMLKSENFNTYTTDLGEEGLDLAKLYDYDIILLDLNLPDMHGYEVLKKVRVARVQTPVLILSGISEMDTKVRSFGFGADDYVTKPFHREELIARIPDNHLQYALTWWGLALTLIGVFTAYAWQALRRPAQTP